MSTALARPGTRADLRSGIRGGLNTAVVRTEIRLFRREPGAIFWILLFPTLLLAILGSIPSFRQPDPSFGGLRPIDAYVPVAVLLGLIVGCLQSMPQSLTGYRERGILRRMSTTPVRPAALLSAQMLVFGGAALVSALLALTVGRLVFDVTLPRQAAWATSSRWSSPSWPPSRSARWSPPSPARRRSRARSGPRCSSR